MIDAVTRRCVLGVVVDIPEPHAAVLSGWRDKVGDPQARVIPPHVTLLPPTPLDAASADEVLPHLREAAAASEPFTMHLAGTGTFRPVSQVVFVQVATGIGECELLADAVRRGPLQRELDYPYHPHVTIAQDVDPTALDLAYEGLRDYTARFTVAGFTMYQQRGDGGWDALHTFPLGAR